MTSSCMVYADSSTHIELTFSVVNDLSHYVHSFASGAVSTFTGKNEMIGWWRFFFFLFGSWEHAIVVHYDHCV